MSEQSWYVIVAAVHVFLLILQQTSPIFVATMPGFRRNGCPRQKKFFSKRVIKDNTKGRLEKFSLDCTTTTVYKVLKNSWRWICDCGEGQKQTIKCETNSKKLNFLVVISVESLSNQWGENCTIALQFQNTTGTFLRQYAMTIKKKPKKIVVSSYDVTGISTSPSFTPYTTSVHTNPASRLGQPSTTATSHISGLTELANLTTLVTGQISPTMIKPRPSQSFIPFYTGIIVSPSIYQSNILQRSVPATPGLATKPVRMTSSLKRTIASSSWTFIQTSITIFEVLSSSTLSPDKEEVKKLKQDIEFIKNVNTSTVKIGDKNTINHILDAAANLIKTNLTADDQAEDPGMQAVEVLEDLGNSISQQLHLGNNKSVTFEKVTEDLVFGAAVINTTTSPGYTFPSDNIRMTGGERINIPNSVFVSDKSYFVGIIFKAYREMRNNTGGLSMGTKVINAVVSPCPGDELQDPVEMSFEKNIVSPTLNQQCSFWIENNTYSGEHGRWSTKQCFKTFENESHIKCACRHFTNFAVLFKVTDEEQRLEKEHSFRLVIITYVGLSLSILGCLLTFLIYVVLPNIKSDRATIHKNLVFALGIADVIFLVTVAVKPDGDLCTAMAMLAFFFYLAVFFWMLVEGVYIYFMVIKVFRGNVARRRRGSYIVGWGCPVIIALVTWAILKHDVVSKYHCWLSVETGAIWAFVGPGLAIILTNCIILIAVMRTTWTTFVDDKEYGGLKSATKTFGALIPILGITWIFGVMAFNDSSIVFQYIFAIVNSIQGALIFILYCIVNKEVRNEINRRITVWQTRREMSSSSGGKRGTYPYFISSEKNTTCNRTTGSAQGTPDLYRYPLSEIKGIPSPEKVEKGYSFETPGKTFKNDLEFEAMEDKDCGQKAKQTSGSGI